MTHVLLTLWDMKVFDETTILTCQCQRRDYRGVSYVTQDNFYPVGINSAGSEPKIIVRRCGDQLLKEIQLPSVLTINGMDPQRFASVFNLNWDGTNQYKGKKRGRKRKSASLITKKL
tara:strand:+ start:14030 stop:14380 length:351 start_codon:yes stop_codon:yes gene_type:complete